MSTQSLQTQSLQTALEQLTSWIERENQSASFTCGGTIPITPSSENSISAEETRRTSPPIRLHWAEENDSHSRNLVLPLSNESPVSDPSLLQQLADDCSPATFGRGEKDVLDVNYRKAGKLDAFQFASTFNLAEFGILENVEQILLPSVSSDMDNILPFRKITAELYKLNIYSGPSGHFRKHVDTPRSSHQIGSLVVCLPVEFKGGSLLVRHNKKEVDYNWSTESASAIQWAAFYSDCEHEIMTVTEGHRVTLTYNLYVTQPVGSAISHSNPIVEPSSLPLYEYVRDLISQPAFFRDGGALGIYCSHAYPHTADHADVLLPRALKGSDLVVFVVLKSLGVKVLVRPVIHAESYDPESDAEFKVRLVGTALHSSAQADDEMEEEEVNVLRENWPSDEDPGIHWLNDSKHQEQALTYIAYGNQASLHTTYSYAAIIAEIPPWNKRGPKQRKRPSPEEAGEQRAPRRGRNKRLRRKK